MDIEALAARLRGKFVVLDGPDGCGKTTQMQRLLDTLTAAGLDVLRLREPGGTAIGEQIRELLLTPKGEGMDVRCEMLLYMASRAQLVQQQIKPALAAGQFVLSDRYVSSTLAYQGAGGGLSTKGIYDVAEVAVNGVWPDVTFIFDLPIDVAMARLVPDPGKKANGKAGRTVHTSQPGLFSDRIEQRDRDYHRRVREGYLAQVANNCERFRLIDASGAIDAVQAQLLRELAAFVR